MFECPLDKGQEGAFILKESQKGFHPQLVMGIRPCDAHGFVIVKRNFDNPQYQDPWWVRRYEATTLVGLGCKDPCPTCFCNSVGDGPFGEIGLDAMMYDLGDEYLVKPITQKGESLVSALGGRDATNEDQRQAEDLKKAAEGKMGPRFETESLRAKTQLDLFNAPYCEDVGFACINCGTCTYLCPTCWCFDIQDEVYKKYCDRIRNWDSCMFPLFTLHGSGHNPREKKFQRVRQRFMHKLKYYVDKYGNGVQCSGCGRCVRYCPVNIDIRQVCQLMTK
jgi:ferredoxin